jgi:hypothetical protein
MFRAWGMKSMRQLAHMEEIKKFMQNFSRKPDGKEEL